MGSANWRSASSPFARCMRRFMTLALPNRTKRRTVTISIPHNSDLLDAAATRPVLDEEPHDLAYAPQGEPLSISERLVVSPVWGRLRPGDHEPGGHLEVGAVIGVVREGDEDFPLLCSTPSVFVSWLASDNERIPPGRAVARVKPLES
jgi:hypothetical protein